MIDLSKSRGEAAWEEASAINMVPEVHVRVADDFKSDNREQTWLKKGAIGRVLKIDEDGDARIKFYGNSLPQWVKKSNYYLLEACAQVSARNARRQNRRSQSKQTDASQDSGAFSSRSKNSGEWTSRSSTMVESSCTGLSKASTGDNAEQSTTINDVSQDLKTESAMTFFSRQTGSAAGSMSFCEIAGTGAGRCSATPPPRRSPPGPASSS